VSEVTEQEIHTMNQATKKKFCKCKENTGIHTLLTQWGYWYVCDVCKLALEDEFHYYSEDEY
jgi:hypothetical protein